ncbi:ADP-sugar pyrophosphatase-like [Saccostrea cucullata]|uniref:ADP-sugar pyrophosphatase-like n=1 Tax=Saccostrea cuccullata TaxID=36930 RepID=UPI002ED423BA
MLFLRCRCFMQFSSCTRFISLRLYRINNCGKNSISQLLSAMATNDTAPKASGVRAYSAKFEKEEEIARGKWLSLNNITYRDPAGKERLWESVKRTTRHSGSADAVGVIAILKRMLKFDCIVLVVQYRPPMQCCTVEFPAGLVDEGESPEVAALRELYEETGYTASVKHVAPASCLDPGIGNTTVQLVTVEIDGNDEKNVNPKQKTG